MKLESFNKVLAVSKVPHFAFVSFKPEELFDYYKLSPVTLKRKVRTGALTSTQVVRIPSKVQKDVYRGLCSLKKVEPYVIGISSCPSDFLALKTAGLVHYALLKNIPNLEWKWINSAYQVGGKGLKVETAPVELVVIYNVIPERERLYPVRDILNRYPRSLRIVVIGGIDAVSYFDDYLRHPISGMINLSGTLKQVESCVRVKSKGKEVRMPVFSDEIKKLVTLVEVIKK